jgi:hypothetical protein
MGKSFDGFIRITPIYIDVFKQHHLDVYLQRFHVRKPVDSNITELPLNLHSSAVSDERPHAIESFTSVVDHDSLEATVESESESESESTSTIIVNTGSG